jgi:glycosyltransferase involved in cell wall biosynthesis
MNRDDRPSVLFVNHRDLASPIGTTFTYYLARGLASSYDVHVVCRYRANERNGESGQRATLHAIDTGDLPVVSGVAFHVAALLYVAFLSLTNRFEVVHSSQSTLVQGWVGARLGGSRFVVALVSVPVRQAQNFREVSGESPSLYTRVSATLTRGYVQLVRALLDRATDVVCLTEGIREVTEQVYDVDLSDAHVIGMGVDVESFTYTPTAEPQRHGDEPWRITYIGAVSTTRNLPQVLEAMATLEHDVVFQVAGQGPDRDLEELFETADRLGIADQLEWLGLVAHEEIPDLLAATDFAVSPLPGIESYRISFPAKLLEYLAVGSVVVATDIQPHRKLIEDGVNGYLYDGTREGLAATLADCIEHESALPAVRQQARATAERYDWTNIVGQYERAVVDEPTQSPTQVPAR